jgi:hypothetical protein
VNKQPWRQGLIPDAIVTDEPSDYVGTGHADIDYYGGYLVCESVEAKHRPLIIAAPQLLEALKAVEWVQVLSDRPSECDVCPCCGRSKKEGHNPVCRVAAALKAAGVEVS